MQGRGLKAEGTDCGHRISCEALPIENAEYGQMYEIRGEISGPNGNSLDVCTIWMTEFATGITKFITMYPDKRR